MESPGMDLVKLKKYYDEVVSLVQDDTKKSIDVVIPIIQNILTYVHETDPRFLEEELRLGSYYQHLKVSQADEFDFSILLDTEAEDWEDTCQEGLDVGYTYISDDTFDDGCRASEYLTNEGYIIPKLVKRRFRLLVAQAIQKQNLGGQVILSHVDETPAIELTITATKINYDISVDLCPMAPVELPFRRRMGWPHPETQWPSRGKKRKIKKIGINAVAKGDKYWRLSFALCERELLKEIDEDDGCRKKSLRILKKLREDFWCTKEVLHDFTSFHLKNILFWECEDFPHERDWEQDSLAIRVESMTKRLLGYLQDETLPMYFYPDVDLLKNKSPRSIRKVIVKIERFLKSPNKYLDKCI